MINILYNNIMASENGILLYNELRGIIGPEATLKVFRILKGQQVYFPESVLKELRDRAIRADFQAGKTYNELARKYHLTEKHLRSLTTPGVIPPPTRQPNPTHPPCHSRESGNLPPSATPEGRQKPVVRTKEPGYLF
ncbi:MAG: Mor transcription activator family protein [Spirochaetota bacterium]